MNKIFKIWSMEYLIFVIIATIICVLIIYLIVVRTMKKYDDVIIEMQTLQSQKDFRGENYIELKDVNNIYRQISILSDVCVYWPVVFCHICLISWGIVDFYYSCTGTVCAVLLTPIFIIGYIHSYHRVKKYNRDLAKIFLVKGTVTEEVIYMPAGFREPSKIIVKYSYIDPQGKEHNSYQAIHKYLTLLKRWKRIYYKGKIVYILLNENNYSDSYLPMSETYSKVYKLFYRVQIEYNTF